MLGERRTGFKATGLFGPGIKEVEEAGLATTVQGAETKKGNQEKLFCSTNRNRNRKLK